MTGTRGPVPKARPLGHPHAKQSESGRTLVEAQTVKPPRKADPKWPVFIQGLWESLGDSGMAGQYEPSDWAMGYLACEVLHEAFTNRNRNGQVNASSIAQANAILTVLGTTEGSRRRLGIELLQQPESNASEAIMASYRKAALNATT